MKSSALRLYASLLLALGLCTALPAQLTLSYSTTSSTAASVSGQSFTPGDAGVFPTTNAYLAQMTFQISGSPNSPSGPVYLDIYADSGLTSYVGSSTNSQTWNSGDNLAIETWNFNDLALDKSTTYYAIYSSDAIAGSLNTYSTYISSSDVYAGGTLMYNGSPSAAYDASFTATFNPTSAVPEPSAFAALAGAAALGLAAWRRRRV